MADICLKFGGNVRKYRIRKGISQEQLAELTGLHRTYISDVERGKRSISLENNEKISISLEVQVYKLFQFDESI